MSQCKMSHFRCFVLPLFVLLSCCLNDQVSSEDVRPLITKKPLLPPFLDDPAFGKFVIPKDSNEVFIFNSKRTSGLASLKLSINGSKIVSHTLEEENRWTWKLEDGNAIYFDITQTDNPKVLKNTIKFPGTSVAGKEICFHYGYNEAAWYGKLIYWFLALTCFALLCIFF